MKSAQNTRPKEVYISKCEPSFILSSSNQTATTLPGAVPGNPIKSATMSPGGRQNTGNIQQQELQLRTQQWQCNNKK